MIDDRNRPVMIVGSRGYLGTAFHHHLRSRGITVVPVNREDFDPLDCSGLEARIRQVGPRFLINAAGFTGKPNVDACESDKAACVSDNIMLVLSLKHVCQRLNLRWGHVSSGCLYTGVKPGGTGYTEQDEPNFSFLHRNCSFYSGAKHLGESFIRDDPRCYIWRPRMVFNGVPGPRNLLTKILSYPRLLDARNSMSHVDEFIAAAWQCVEKQVPTGIYHMTNPGSITTREITEMMLELGLTDQTFHFFQDEAEFMRHVQAPRSNCVLHTDKLAGVGIYMSPVGLAVRQALLEYRERIQSASEE